MMIGFLIFVAWLTVVEIGLAMWVLMVWGFFSWASKVQIFSPKGPRNESK